MKSLDAAVAQLFEVALATIPGALFSHRLYLAGALAACLYLAASRRTNYFRDYHSFFPRAARSGLVIFVAWSIAGLVASISLPLKLLLTPPLVIGTVIYGLVSRPKASENSEPQVD
jgi:hypothetical protein